jgi:hypothetical protein
MKASTTRLLLTLAAMILMTGCAAAGSRSSASVQQASRQSVKFFVNNLAFNDVTVFAVVNGARQRLGRVSGKREMEFSMPLRVPSAVYVEIDILAGPRCSSERMMVEPGDHLQLDIQSSLDFWDCRGAD